MFITLMDTPLYNINLKQWMSELPYSLQHKPLVNLAIPGSHDCGSYSLVTNKGIAPDKVSLTDLPCVRKCPTLVTPIIKKWSKTQKVDIINQLESGIRYFDMRVANRSDELYFVHGLYGDNIIDICLLINEFLKNNLKEIVIIDFQHFYNLSPQQLDDFVQKILLIFGVKICPFSELTNVKDITLSSLWDKNYQVIICFRNDEICSKCTKVWPSRFFPNPWANTRHTCKLIPFLTGLIEDRSIDHFFISQGVLTPNTAYVLRNLNGSLKSKLAENCNEKIDEWLQFIKIRQVNLNIVMTDFIEWDDFKIPRRIIFHNYNYVY